MELQQLFNIVVMISATAGGWFMKTLWGSVSTLSDKVSGLDKLVAGEYVKREEFNEVAGKLHDKLDRILDKLSSKVDKK